MLQSFPGRFVSRTAPLFVAIALVSWGVPYAGQLAIAATETPQPTMEATATATSTPTPRSTRTPTPTATPVPVLTPLPSLDDLRFYTPVAEEPAGPLPEEPVAPTRVPPVGTAPVTNQPPRAPVRATTREEPAPTRTPVQETAGRTSPDPTAKPAAPLPTAASRSSRLPQAPVSNAQPPINLTPAGVAGGGPTETRAPLASKTLIVLGIGLLAAGGSWGFYYLLRESD